MSTSQRDIKPVEYGHSCVVKHETAFDHVAGSRGTQASVGVLQAGRVIWLQSTLANSTPGTPTSAYVDGIGVIQLDPECLSAVV